MSLYDVPNAFRDNWRERDWMGLAILTIGGAIYVAITIAAIVSVFHAAVTP